MGYQGHLVSHPTENENFGLLGDSERDNLQLENIAGAVETEDPRTIGPKKTPGKPGRNRKEPVEEDQPAPTPPVKRSLRLTLQIPKEVQNQEEVPEEQANKENQQPQTAEQDFEQLQQNRDQSQVDLNPATPGINPATPYHNPETPGVPATPGYNPATPYHNPETPGIPATPAGAPEQSQQNTSGGGQQMENMGYDQTNPNQTQMANLGWDHGAPTPGGAPSMGAPTPYREDDYYNPESVASVKAAEEEQMQEGETIEEFEDRVLNKRAGHLNKILQSKFEHSISLQFADLTRRNLRKQ